MKYVDQEQVFVANAHPTLDVDEDRVRKMASAVLKKEQRSGRANIILGTDVDLTELNSKYRRLDRPTDVLSFPMDNDTHLADHEQVMGEVYISLDRAQQQAQDYGVDFLREVDRLVIHGLLHLCGYDHEDPNGTESMKAKEEEFLEMIS
jgi:probable rRNA maturation factor